MNNLTVTNIQRYSIHDGHGIRTTVFFKGCPLRCSWCHNPETQDFKPQVMWRTDMCRGCMECVKACPTGAMNTSLDSADGLFPNPSLCTGCGSCCDACFYGARSLAGKSYTVSELVRLVMQDKMFYESSGGGVTLSGGEVMASDIDAVAKLCEELHKSGVSVNIDSCGMAAFESFERILPFVDTFLYDIKLMDGERHKKYTGADNKIILCNLSRLSEAGAGIALRLPLIDGINTSEQDIEAIIEYLHDFGIVPRSVHLLPYHEIGSDKYARLGIHAQSDTFTVPDNNTLDRIRLQFESAGFSNVCVGG